MNRSLQRHLTFTLTGTLLLAVITISFASFWLAYREAKELQDDMLRQIAVLSSSNDAQSSTQSGNVTDEMLNDPESRVSVLHLPDDKAPSWLPATLPQGLHSIVTTDTTVRVFVLQHSSGRRTVIYQPTEAGDEIALNSALRTLIPMLLLLPFLALLLSAVVRRELAPVTTLTKDLDDQLIERLSPLAISDVPQEIAPFIHAINRLLARINSLLTQQRRFIADASHELRSPLTALSLQVANLARANSMQEMQARVLPLQAGIERARQLTEQLLTLARVQTGGNSAETIDVSEMARELIAESLPLAEAKQIDLGLNEIAKISLCGARLTLKLLLKNALENAVKYTPDGGEVTLCLRVESDTAILDVIDNGTGIPDTERERVFDAFYRMPSSQGEGNGLGLAIAQEAAMSLGGSISLHTPANGTGTVFRYQQKFTIDCLT